MWDFIVSGTIPGTSFELTFNGVIAVATVLLGGVLLRVTDKHATVRANNKRSDGGLEQNYTQSI